MFHIRSSMYMHLFYFLMFISLILLTVYKFQYNKIDDSLKNDASNKENINLLYLKTSIKKENNILSSIYSNIEDTNFDKAATQVILDEPTIVGNVIETKILAR